MDIKSKHISAFKAKLDDKYNLKKLKVLNGKDVALYQNQQDQQNLNRPI